MNEACSEFETQISSYIDGQLSPGEADACRRHLETCDRCRRLYERVAAGTEVLRAIPSPEPPEGLLAAIMADAEREIRRRERTAVLWSRSRVPVAVAAAAAAVLLAVFAPWQVDRATDSPAVCPVTEPPVVATTKPDLPEQSPIAQDDPAEQPEPEIAAVPSAPRAPAPAYSTDETHAEPEVRESVEAEAVEAPVEPEAEPELAFAPPEAAPEAKPEVEPVLAEAGPTVVALGPRTTIDEEATPASNEPSALDTEIANGVVARMIVDRFIAENMVESSPTMLSVVTDTPTSEMGPLLTDESGEGGFGLCFTDAMRRALSESENQLP